MNGRNKIRHVWIKLNKLKITEKVPKLKIRTTGQPEGNEKHLARNAGGPSPFRRNLIA